ncbi:MAG TPA: antitoxin Xre/MbcA/ParS toxin-binding domain-containing protein [Gaiellaceae bacterium]
MTVTERLDRAATALELERSDVARIVEANPRTVARWLRREVEPRAEARERLLEVVPVLERLAGTVRPAAAHDWLFTPNRDLDHHKPVDLLRQGEYRRVLGAVDALAEGVFV